MSITCPRCKHTSHNPNDERERFCGFCHIWLDDLRYRCLDCAAERHAANDGAEVTCETCGGFRMVEVGE